jgi:L-rhamnose mutarotase
MKRHCFALDLKNDPALITEYERMHRQVWPEILQSIREAGIESMEIYRVFDRLFMIMEVNDSFSIEAKSAADQENEAVQRWEKLMWTYQQALPMASPGSKWMMMDRIFELTSQG